MGAGENRSVLLVTAAPDDRTSTSSLRVVADELSARPGIDLTVWVLRPWPGGDWPGAFVVDSLRTWAPARLLDLVGLSAAAAKLRGLRLRLAYRRASPDLIVLDDGLGDRALVGGPGRATIVVRYNDDLPPDAALEPPLGGRVDVVLGDPSAERPLPPDAAPRARLASPYFRHYDASVRMLDPLARGAERERLGVPVEARLVVGWGSAGWVDGPDLFVRALWALERHHGVLAHGLWLGLGADPHEVDRLRAEAERCGVADRFHLVPDDAETSRCCGDAVFLPYRAPGEPTDALAAVVSGLEVVTFPTCRIDDPGVVVVDDLDVDAAAAALAAALDTDRSALAAAAVDRVGVAAWVDRLLGVVWGSGSS